MASMWRELREREADLKRAREDLIANGFSDDQLDYVFRLRAGSVGAEIVAMAQAGNYDTIILSHKASRAVPAFRRNVHDKVLSSLKDRTVSIIL